MTENLDQNMSGNHLQIGDEAKQNLLTAAKWANFLAILGFIGLGFMLIAGLIMFAFIPSQAYGLSPILRYMPLMYLLFALLYFFPTMYMYKFASNMKIAVLSMNQNNSDDAIGYLKSFFKFIGVATIIVISLYILSAILIAATAATMPGMIR